MRFRVLLALAAAQITTSAPATVAGSSIEEFAELAMVSSAPITSPNGEWTALVVEKGDVRRNVVSYDLILIDNKLVQSRMSASTDQGAPLYKSVYTATTKVFDGTSAISRLTWMDSSTIVFVSRDVSAGDADRVMELDVLTGEVRRRSHIDGQIAAFSVAKKSLFYCVDKPVIPTSDEADLGIQVSGVGIDSLLEGNIGKKLDCIIEDDKTPRAIHNAVLERRSMYPSPSLSPDGRYLIYLERFADNSVPTSWKSLGLERFGRKVLGGGAEYNRLRILDLKTGKDAILIDRPLYPNMEGISAFGAKSWLSWSPDGKSVAIAGVAGSRDSNSQLDAVVIDLAENRFIPLGRFDGAQPALRWISRDRILVRTGSQVITMRNRGKWRLETLGAQAPTVEISVQANTSGKGGDLPLLDVWASAGSESFRVIELNPNLKNRRSGQVRAFSWNDGLGREFSGDLVLPSQFNADQRYPLAVTINGSPLSNSPAMPVRELVNRGIIVLALTCSSRVPSPRVSEAISICIDAAVDKLAAQGLVDSSRVGLLGFSYSGNQVLNAVTFSTRTYAAASIVDSIQSTPLVYSMQLDLADRPSGMAQFDDPVAMKRWGTEAHFQGPPFGRNLQDWLNHSPAFSLDRIRTPIRFEAHGSMLGTVAFWDTYANLRRQNRPVELVYYPRGGHDLAGPLQRLSSASMIVDWFDFWLNGREDAGSAKAIQYKRWRWLREQRDEVAREPRPALPSWVEAGAARN